MSNKRRLLPWKLSRQGSLFSDELSDVLSIHCPDLGVIHGPWFPAGGPPAGSRGYFRFWYAYETITNGFVAYYICLAVNVRVEEAQKQKYVSACSILNCTVLIMTLDHSSVILVQRGTGACRAHE